MLLLHRCVTFVAAVFSASPCSVWCSGPVVCVSDCATVVDTQAEDQTNSIVSGIEQHTILLMVQTFRFTGPCRLLWWWILGGGGFG